MTLQLDSDLLVLVVCLAVLIFWLGAAAEYLWHAIHHRRR